MLMPGRKFSAGSGYRYGFNGKENDNEVKGEGNQQDYGMRIYDPRLGRFLSVDPVTDKYPELTPYQFASNRPIDGIDLDGLEWWKDIVWAINPALGAVTDKDVREGFTQRAKEFVHSLKNLPAVVQRFVDANGKLGTPGGAFVKNQEVKRNAFNMQMGEGIVASGKELWTLAKSAANGDKKATGALLFEAAILIIPEVDGLKGLSVAGKFGEVLSAESRSLVKVVGKFEGASREIAIGTKTGKSADAITIARDLTGDIPNDATLIKGSQGILDGSPVGFEWRGDDGIFKQIRFDNDLKVGNHINVKVGKNSYSIPYKANEAVKMNAKTVAKKLKQ